jgi:hypothetical protein
MRHVADNNNCDKREKREQQKRAFIFTTDAIIAIPIVIIIITAFMALSTSLRESLFYQEYVYTLARDRLMYLEDLPYGDGNSVLGAIINESINGNAGSANAIAEQYLNPTMPDGTGYVLERFDSGSKKWIIISDNSKKGRYTSSAVRLVVMLTSPYLEIDGNKIQISDSTMDYLATYTWNDCAGSVACGIPRSLYRGGTITGPILVRLRVQM